MKLDDLPKKIAVFPLGGAIFFPQTTLPLNIFEKRYIQMVEDCMKGKRLLGMIQSKSKLPSDIYQIGCLGKITSFNETSDKRFIISLAGIIRFKIKDELSSDKLYRQFNVDYSDFLPDLDLKKNKNYNSVNKNIIRKIKNFFSKKNYLIEFKNLEELNFDQMISTICMIAPFSPQEKQKLLETQNIEDKVKALDEIINFDMASYIKNETVQ